MSRIIKIIPFKKLPRGMDYFDYLAPKDLENKIKIGQLVEAPFKKQKISGIVYGFASKSEFEHLKEITSLKTTVPYLFDYQLKLCEWFSKYYCYSLASTLKLFLAEKPKRRVEVQEKFYQIEKHSLAGENKVKKLSEQIYCSTHKKFLLFPYYHEDFKNLFYLSLIKEMIKNNKQILILFPQKYKIFEFYAYLNDNLRKKTTIITNELYNSKTRYFQAWEKIKNNEIQVILGTRSAVCAPLQKPELIIIDSAHSDDYKQWDQSPRYQAITIARKIQELTKCKLIISSLTPRIEDSFAAKKENYKMISLGGKIDQKIKIIDLKEERKKEFTYLSEELIEKIIETKEKGEKSVLIVNKKGLYSYFFCEDCGFAAKCPQCRLPLIVETDERLACCRCNYKTEIYLSCPKCGGANLKKLGTGIEKIKQELEGRLKLTTYIIKEGSIKIPHDASLILTTGQALAKTVWENIGFLGFIYIDSLVYLADFNSNFKLFSFMNELIHQARSSIKLNNVFVQTCFPQNSVFRNLSLGYNNFYQEEIKNRKQFNYPPFSTLIKLFFQHHDLKVCSREADDLFKKLEKVIKQNNGAITEPYLHYARKVRKKFRCQMAVFLPFLPLDKENEILSIIPEYWTIDKEPKDLL